MARREGADAVSHGATGKGNDQVRFELTYAALAPDLAVIAPWREWDLDSRTALIEFARRHDIPVPVTTDRPYSTDRNLFHISFEGGILEDPWTEPPPKMFLLTNSPESAPDVPVYVEIEYEAGNPVAVDGRRLAPVALLEALNRLGGEHGIGRVDLVENRYVGMKSRGVYETPGGTILHAAHRAIESLTLDREVLHLRDSLVPRYAEMIYYGFWFAPEREALQGLIDQVQRDVTGTVRLKLYKGTVTVAGRKSPRSLYRTDFVTFEADQRVPPAGRRRASSTSTRSGSRSERSATAIGSPADSMRVHVALTPAEFPGLALGDRAAVVVDVLRATTTLVAACAAGCARIVPGGRPRRRGGRRRAVSRGRGPAGG